MSPDSKPVGTPTVDIEDLTAATTVEDVVKSSTVTWSSTDDRGANDHGGEPR